MGSSRSPELADKVELHQSQIHRYESGCSQPTLEALRRIALALGVSIDELVFEVGEVPDDELRLQAASELETLNTNGLG